MKAGLAAVAVSTVLATMGTAAQAEISDGVVRIGVMNDMSGLYADVAGPNSVVAAKLAIEDFQKQFKPDFKIEVVSADHQNKPDVGATIVRKWYDADGVDAVFDVPTSSVALAVSEITREKNKAFLDSGAGTSDLTGKSCSPNTIHWAYDTWMLSNGTGRAIVDRGGDSWFFLTADYAFGHALERDTTGFVQAGGGKVLGSVRHPINTSDFSSFLLQAQASKAKVIGLANAGGDTINAIKQAAEFGIVAGGQSLAGLLMFITDIHSLGLQTAQGLLFTTSFYWNMNDGTRAFAERFRKAGNGNAPTMVHAGVYSSVLHYLKSVQALNSDEGLPVIEQMKKTKTDDPVYGQLTIRPDGRTLVPAYLVEAKKPSESSGEWDLLKIVTTIPPEQAFRPMAEGGCSLVK